jgi:hypothetical protein
MFLWEMPTAIRLSLRLRGRVTRVYLSNCLRLWPAGGTSAANSKNEKFGTFSFYEQRSDKLSG